MCIGGSGRHHNYHGVYQFIIADCDFVYVELEGLIVPLMTSWLVRSHYNFQGRRACFLRVPWEVHIFQ
jgi:hypothetical protein